MVELAEQEAVIYAAPARALPLEGARAAAGGLSREELLARALERAGDADFLRENPPYFWRAEISSSRLDAYHTVMMDSTLKNFARDAEAGVPFQPSHNVRMLPFGASLAGRFHNGRRSTSSGSGDTPARVEADFYTVPGLRTNDVSTDDLIRGQKAGILRDVSVGFTGGKTICSICERDMDGGWLDYLFGDASADEVCLHFPGETYELKDAEGKKTGEKALCVGRIEDAQLIEVSQVYRGATPGAAVQKARTAAEAGKLPPELARRLEHRYRIALPQSRHTWAGYRAAPATSAIPAKETTPMPEPQTEPQPQEQRDSRDLMVPPAVREALAQMGFAPAADSAQAAEDAARKAAEEFGRLRQREQELAPLADDGKAYRAALLEEALHEGKRAHGTAFPEESYRTLLAAAPVEHIRQVRDGFKTAANALVQPGQRVDATATEDRPAAAAKPADAYPDRAYRAR